MTVYSKLNQNEWLHAHMRAEGSAYQFTTIPTYMSSTMLSCRCHLDMVMVFVLEIQKHCCLCIDDWIALIKIVSLKELFYQFPPYLNLRPHLMH